MRHIAHKHPLMLVISQKAETSAAEHGRALIILFDFQGQQADAAAAGQPGGQLQDPHDCLYFSQRQVFLLISIGIFVLAFAFVFVFVFAFVT